MADVPIASALVSILPNMPDFQGAMSKLKSHLVSNIHQMQAQANAMQVKLLNSLNVSNAMNALHRSIVPIVGAIGAISAIRFGYSVAADAQRAEVAFEVMLHSAAKAKAMLGEIQSYANETPYNFPGVRESAKLLLQLGINAKNVMPLIRSIGDIAAGDANKMHSLALALGQTNQAGRLMGGEMIQYINAGFNPLNVIAKRTGESMVKLKERMHRGAITAHEVSQAFSDATSAGGDFYQMSQKQSKTTAGLLSTLQDTITASSGRIATIFIKAFGVNDIIQNLTKITDSVEQFIRANTTNFTQFGGRVRAIFGEIYETITSRMSAAADFVRSVFGPSLTRIVDGIVKLNINVSKLASNILTATSAMMVITTSINLLKMAFFSLSVVMSLNPLGIFVAGVGAVVFAIMTFREQIMEMINSNAEWAAAAQVAFGQVTKALANLPHFAEQVATSFLGNFKRLFKFLSDGFRTVFGVEFPATLQDAIALVLKFANGAADYFSLLTDDWSNTWDLMKLVAAKALDSIGLIAKAAFEMMGRGLGSVANAWQTVLIKTQNAMRFQAGLISAAQRDRDDAAADQTQEMNDRERTRAAQLAERQKQIEAARTGKKTTGEVLDEQIKMQMEKMRASRDSKAGPDMTIVKRDKASFESEAMSDDRTITPDDNQDPTGKHKKHHKDSDKGKIEDLHDKIQTAISGDKSGSQIASNTAKLVELAKQNNALLGGKGGGGAGGIDGAGGAGDKLNLKTPAGRKAAYDMRVLRAKMKRMKARRPGLGIGVGLGEKGGPKILDGDEDEESGGMGGGGMDGGMGGGGGAGGVVPKEPSAPPIHPFERRPLDGKAFGIWRPEHRGPTADDIDRMRRNSEKSTSGSPVHSSRNFGSNLHKGGRYAGGLEQSMEGYTGGSLTPTAMMNSQSQQQDDKMVAALNTLVDFGRQQEGRDNRLIEAVKTSQTATYG